MRRYLKAILIVLFWWIVVGIFADIFFALLGLRGVMTQQITSTTCFIIGVYFAYKSLKEKKDLIKSLPNKF